MTLCVILFLCDAGFETFCKVEEEEISLCQNEAPPKVPCDTLLQAFDTKGNEIKITPQSHVSSSCFVRLIFLN